MSTHPGYEFHPAAEALPSLEGEALDALDTGIKAKELIYDGRSRIRACLAAGIEPRFVEFAGDDPVAFIILADIERRHRAELHRAVRAARLATLHLIAWRGPRTLRRGCAIGGRLAALFVESNNAQARPSRHPV